MNTMKATSKIDITKVKEYLDKKWLRQATKGHLQVLCYNEVASRKKDWQWDEITLNCRGVVINKDTGDIVAHCMPKSFNANERPDTLTKDLDLSSPCHITEKMDGSLITSFVDPVTKDFIHTTKCSFNTIYSKKANEFFPDVPRPLYEGYTFVSEIRLKDQDEDMRRVTRRKPGMYLITVFDREGKEVSPTRVKAIVDFISLPNLRTVEHYDTKTLKEVVDNYPYLKGTEGFVVRFKDGKRIKFKTAWYRALNYTLDEMHTPEKKKAYIKEMFLREKTRNWIDNLPEDIRPELHEAVDKLVLDFGLRKDIIELMVRNVKGMSRPEIGKMYGKHPYQGPFFFMLDGNIEDADKLIWESL